MLKRIAAAALLAVVLVFSLADFTLATAPAAVSTRQTARREVPGLGAGSGGAASVQVESAVMNAAQQTQEAQAASEAQPQPEAQDTPGDRGTPEPQAEPEGQQAAGSAAGDQAEGSNFYVNGQPKGGMRYQFFDEELYCSLRALLEGTLDQAWAVWENGQVRAGGAAPSGQELYLTARPGDSYILANDRCLYVEKGVKLEGDVVMIPATLVSTLFPGGVTWYDGEKDALYVNTAGSLLAGGGQFYDAQSLDLLGRVIQCEAGNQPLRGKIAVGNVVLNRVASKQCPNTVYDVLYQPNQFTVVHFASFRRPASAQCVIAAKLALEGVMVVPNALFYNTVGLRSWASRNRPYITTIADHEFYG